MIGELKSIFQFGGFYLDTMVLASDDTQSNVAVECNGGHDLDAEEAYSHLQYRQKLLQSYDCDYEHLWSLNFWKNPKKSFDDLLEWLS